jgi:streptogramin lyase
MGTAASFSMMGGVAVDSSGNVYVADTLNFLIRKITPAGDVTTFAGSGVSGSGNGTGAIASFNMPTGIAVDSSGNVYVADMGNNLIRKITPAGDVSTFAGGGGSGDEGSGADDGIGIAASFNMPTGIAVDSSGNVYVADFNNNLIRKITPAGDVTKLAGSFPSPSAVAVDSSGNVYATDLSSQLIKKITPAGVITTLAGGGGSAADGSGADNGTGTAASFNSPTSIAVDSSGNVYVADMMNDLIRKITPDGVVTTLAGSGTSGDTDGIGTAASFFSPYGIAADSSGNLYVSDSDNFLVRKITY